MKPKAFIRADGNGHIGYGHVVRCISLCLMIREKFDVSFLTIDSDDGVRKMLAIHGIENIALENEGAFFALLVNGSVVVLDGYGFDTPYQIQVKKKGALLVCIDDLHDKHFVADVIINHAPGALPQLYSFEPGAKLLLGTKYAMLRPAFLKQAASRRRIGPLTRIALCFGGADPKNLTQKLLRILCKDNRIKEIIVITGGGYAFESELLNTVNMHDGHVTHIRQANEVQMLNALLSAQLAIVPASGMLFETIACKTPAVAGFYVENQRAIYEGFKKHNAFFDAVDFSDDYFCRALNQAMESDLNSFISRYASLIDGRSPERLLEAIGDLKDHDGN